MDFLKFHPVPPCPTVLRPLGGAPLKWPYGCFRGGPPTGRLTCGHPHLDTLHRTLYTYVKDRDFMCSRNNLDNYFVLDICFHLKIFCFSISFAWRNRCCFLKLLVSIDPTKDAFQQFMLLSFHVILRFHSEPKRVMNGSQQQSYNPLRYPMPYTYCKFLLRKD
jgi:hypothetical protein